MGIPVNPSFPFSWDVFRDSAFIADNVPEKIFSFLYIYGTLHSFAGETVHHSHHPASLIGFGDENLEGVGSGGKDAAHLLNTFDAIHNIDGITLAEHHNEKVPCRNFLGVLYRRLYEILFVAVMPYEAWP
jgi:hypothetical protein